MTRTTITVGKNFPMRPGETLRIHNPWPDKRIHRYTVGQIVVDGRDETVYGADLEIVTPVTRQHGGSGK